MEKCKDLPETNGIIPIYLMMNKITKMKPPFSYMYITLLFFIILDMIQIIFIIPKTITERLIEIIAKTLLCYLFVIVSEKVFGGQK